MSIIKSLRMLMEEVELNQQVSVADALKSPDQRLKRIAMEIAKGLKPQELGNVNLIHDKSKREVTVASPEKPGQDKLKPVIHSQMTQQGMQYGGAVKPIKRGDKLQVKYNY